MTLDVQMQLDEDDSSSADNDDDMPQLSPVTDVSTSSSVYPSSATLASTSDRSVVQLLSSAGGGKFTTADDVGYSQLYCVCRTPYDETK